MSVPTEGRKRHLPMQAKRIRYVHEKAAVLIAHWMAFRLRLLVAGGLRDPRARLACPPFAPTRQLGKDPVGNHVADGNKPPNVLCVRTGVVIACAGSSAGSTGSVVSVADSEGPAPTMIASLAAKASASNFAASWAKAALSF